MSFPKPLDRYYKMVYYKTIKNSQEESERGIMEKYLNTLKAGDTVTIRHSILETTRQTIVTKITKTQIVVKEGQMRYKRETGWVVGGGHLQIVQK